jgi:hypothetical protein
VSDDATALVTAAFLDWTDLACAAAEAGGELGLFVETTADLVGVDRNVGQ